MNKSAIQRFAIWARNTLIAQVSQRAYQYGITADGYGEENAVIVGGRTLSYVEQGQRAELVMQIRSKGYSQVMEEVAYTWFNRFIALRFMEVNNYLPSHIRVFSDSTGAFKPEILSDALHLDLPGLDRDRVAEFIESNQQDGLYRYLLLTQCNALNESLPLMFEKMGGFTELLLPNNILKQDSVIGHMVTDIPEEDWTEQVQIIGWLYQYYNTELKDETFALLKGNVKITKERLPSATQLFTPDWIVRYMIENSLGRLWIEGHPDDKLKAGWKYFLDEAEQEAEVQAQLEAIREEYRTLKPQDIKVIDPCMGSGHILAYAFDVLVGIYKSCGISERDAAQSILKNNLYGLDIDERAAQLAYFAVMMTACKYDRRIFSRGIQPHVYPVIESNGQGKFAVEYFINGDPTVKQAFETLTEELRDAKEYGSILSVSSVDFAALYARFDEVRGDISLHHDYVLNNLLPFVRACEIMAQKYHVVVTNPPYMGSSGMNAVLSEYLKRNYPDSKSDLFAVFIEKCGQMSQKNGYYAMITQHAWMFLSSFENLRMKMFFEDTVNMAHLGARAFDEIGGEVVQTTTFVNRNSNIADYKGVYCRLIDPKSEKGKENMFLAGENRFIAKKSNFEKIPGSPVAYWLGKSSYAAFTQSRVGDTCVSKCGMGTSNNNLFLRMWYEVNINNIGYHYTNIEETKDCKFRWMPYDKGGEYRKWYGNRLYVVNFYNNGADIRWATRDATGGRVVGTDYYFKEHISWSDITSGENGYRWFDSGFIFDACANAAFYNNEEDMYFGLGYYNSCPVAAWSKILNPTYHFKISNFQCLPFVKSRVDEVVFCAKQNISLSKTDWDSFETSWDFKRHPLLNYRIFIQGGLVDAENMEKAPPIHMAVEKISTLYKIYEKGVPQRYTIESSFEQWRTDCSQRFNLLKANEEELNRIFIEIYGLQDELTPEVEDKDVTVRRADLQREIKSLISYAVGCMFGRYSLDVDGLVYAGGEWDDSKYVTFTPDSDNIIPICDDDYFDDDITGRFVKWVETVYGKDTLEENLKFIADALGGKGTPREVIRNYFLNDFYTDHCRIYQKRPIYWLFDSGKKNGFKALIYMHRYRSDLLARMRTDYVHEQQERYRTQLSHLSDAIEHAGTSERVRLARQQKKLQEQSLEIQKYEEKIHHLADRNITIDLDDGVKHNYELFSEVLAKLK